MYPQLWRCPDNKPVNLTKANYYSQGLEDRIMLDMFFRFATRICAGTLEPSSSFRAGSLFSLRILLAFCMYHSSFTIRANSPVRALCICSKPEPHRRKFFLEIGALDGTTYSNTRFFEESLDWRGVLIEAHPSNSAKLAGSGRDKAVFVASAICEQRGRVDIMGSGNAVSGIRATMKQTLIDKFHQTDGHIKTSVTCSPMGALLRRIGLPHIDFWSLDVEGAEMMVLRSMDWTIPVHVLMVETNIESRDYLKERGFELLEVVSCAACVCESFSSCLNRNLPRFSL